MAKYSLTKNSIEVFGKKLFQIKAEMSFGNVSKGDLGGYIEKEDNLSQENNAWVSGNAMVSGNAWVSGNAMVSGNAEVSGNAWVSGNAMVYGNAEVSGNAWVYGNAEVSGNAWVYGNARVSGNAEVSGKIKLSLGCFFGMRYNKEEIKYVENEGQEIICKGDIEVNKGDEVKETIKIGDHTYDKSEVEKRLKGLKEIN
jgi:carbonic anhydrase/acetyltransferase-like protein (isoleucine patch superfamily)